MQTRERMLRKRAATLGLRASRRENGFALLDVDGVVVLVDSLKAVEAYVRQRYIPCAPGPKPWLHAPHSWVAAIEAFLTMLAAGGQPDTTIKLRRSQLGRMARDVAGPAEVALAAVTGEQLVTWLGSNREWSQEYRRSIRSVTKQFFLWCYRTGRIPVHIADELPKVRQPKAFARPLPDQILEAALNAADQRQWLMLRLAAECGLRRAEIAQVHRRDLTQGAGGWQLHVHGKGGKPRRVPLSEPLANEICAAAPGGWLFPNGNGGHLTADRVGKVAQRVLPNGWTLHTLRHRFATRCYRASRNLRAVQVLLGHSSIATTERYLAVDDDEIRAAAAGAW